MSFLDWFKKKRTAVILAGAVVLASNVAIYRAWWKGEQALIKTELGANKAKVYAAHTDKFADAMQACQVLTHKGADASEAGNRQEAVKYFSQALAALDSVSFNALEHDLLEVEMAWSASPDLPKEDLRQCREIFENTKAKFGSLRKDIQITIQKLSR